MTVHGIHRFLTLVMVMVVLCFPLVANGQSIKPIDEGIWQFSSDLTKAFNSGQGDQIASMFLADGELIDEQGTVHSGHDQIKELLQGFFAKFPGSTMLIETESIRQAGPVVIDDGTRIITDANGVSSMIRYSAVMVPTEQGWRIASIRDFPEETLPTSGEMLQSLSWLIGVWINEGVDGKVEIHYRWSDDQNFILGDFVSFRDGQETGRSSQRIGWDPLLAKPRSWLFDSDGGFSQAVWTETDSGWLVTSSATLPDGQTGSATLSIRPESDNRFILGGFDRIVGNQVEDDFEIVVVKRPQAAEK